MGVDAPSSKDSFEVTGKSSKYGTGQLLKPGMVPALDSMLKSDSIVRQLGVLYRLSQKYGVVYNGDSVSVTEFFATLDLGLLGSNRLYSNTEYLTAEVFKAGGWKAWVDPYITNGDVNSGFMSAIAHTHMISSVPSDGHDFAWDSRVSLGKIFGALS